ncbi:GtrA family protein [Microvirga sp. 2MCAF35]|uniref:GtrA family protein n=1 Tax=Microvirga sp. 2MCAF35 TaxID=3232987 RepID=UPI003F9960CA
MSLFLTRQFMQFLLAGGLAAIANFSSRFLFEIFFSFETAIIAAFGVGLAVAFSLNKTIVFLNSDRSLTAEIVWFCFFNGIAFPITLGLSSFLHWNILSHFFSEGISKAFAHAVGIIIPVFTNFAAHKFITFREKRRN